MAIVVNRGQIFKWNYTEDSETSRETVLTVLLLISVSV